MVGNANWLSAAWSADTPGLVRLPGGTSVRGRSLRRPPASGPDPEFALHLRARPLREPPPWPVRLIRWPDFLLPLDRRDAADAFRETLERSRQERVEVGCPGGVGRTGTAIAVLAVLDGLAPNDAVALVRAAVHPKAVETPWQRRYVRSFARAR
jgi:protein-tyrosine phosphatase